MDKLDETPRPSSGILALDPAHYREIDGVIFDLDSYERHRSAVDMPAPVAAPAHGVFLANPQHNGWYPAEEDGSRYPVMGGPLPLPTVGEAGMGQALVTRMIGSGSFAGSYLTSYLTSFSGSLRSSFLGSGSFGGSGCLGGYGLELI